MTKIEKHPNNYNKHNKMKGLHKRVITGGLWALTLRFLEVLCHITRLVILARILSPKDFGLLGIALLAMASLETFTRTGFEDSLIQKKGDVSSYLDSAWTIQVVRGITLTIIIIIIAPLVSSFFNEPESSSILRILGLSILFQGFINIGVVFFQKELEFHKQFIFRFSATLVNLIVAVIAALILQNVWALVLGIIAGDIVRLIVSYIIHPFRPCLSIQAQKANELFSYGKYILGTSILKFFITQGDDAFLGKMLGTATLGLYQMAYRISNLVATEISNVLTQVTFPTYSKLQDSLDDLKIGYIKTTMLTSIIVFPIAGGIYALSGEFTMIFMGKKWLPMVPAMQLLCFLGALKAIEYDALFKSIGRPDIPTKMSVIRLSIIIIFIYPLTKFYGMSGTALSVIIGSFAIVPITIYKAMRIISYKILEFLKLLVYPTISTILMILALKILTNMMSPINLWKLIFLLIWGVTVYAFCILFIDLMQKNYKPLNIVRDIYKGLK